jgi:lipopolysaccharide/colanic/teichoic acid biosynthesis glycosyltransferase
MVRWSKRLVDVVAASVGLVVLSPLLVVVAIAVLVLDGRPVLFTQRRSGLSGEPFELHKFRSMSTGSHDPTTDAQRITRLGAVLRSTSLDELPTLWDVARGAMSLVGPRPLPERYLDRYTPEQRRRLEVRPGVTGLAQVRGRNLLSWEERFSLDVAYVDTWSFAGDIKLLLETFRSVVRREGIEADGAVTMPEFRGSVDPEGVGADG